MDNTTKQFIYFEENQFYAITPIGRNSLSEQQLADLKPGYILVISDSELFYTTMEFPDAPKRKLDMFISNYLLGTFPQQLCSKFCYMSKGDKILIGIFSAAFEETFQQFEKVFSKAAYITSPMAGVYRHNDNFSYVAGGISINIEDSIIMNTEGTQAPLQPDPTPSIESKLNLPFVKNRSGAYEEYRIPAAILIACFLIFTVGDYMRLHGYKNNLKKAENMLQTVYKKAGVADSRDPYGKLLSMAGGDENSSKYNTLFILEKISKGHNENIVTDSIDIKGKTVTFQGSSTDYAFLEQFQKELAKVTGKDVQIVDTVKKEGRCLFLCEV